MGTIDLWTNDEKNRLYVVMEGYFNENDIDTSISKLNEALAKVKPNFDMIHDFSKVEPASKKSFDKISNSVGMVIEKGLKRLVRIPGKSILAKTQIEKQDVKDAPVKVFYATSLKEAEEILDRK